MGRKLSFAVMSSIRESVRQAFAYLRKHKGHDYVIYEGEMYFDEKTLVRALERNYQKGTFSPVSTKPRCFL